MNELMGLYATFEQDVEMNELTLYMSIMTKLLGVYHKNTINNDVDKMAIKMGFNSPLQFHLHLI